MDPKLAEFHESIYRALWVKHCAVSMGGYRMRVHIPYLRQFKDDCSQFNLDILSVDRITTADTNRFNLLKGKMRMGNSVLNSKRSTGLLFSFLSPTTLRNSPSGELEQL